jgi:predicted MPP superfamily phosphohydrolase
MILFLSTILILYGLLHLYIFYKVKAALAFGAGGAILLICFMVIMIISPVIVRIVERYGFELFVYILSLIGYIWMGFAFLFFSCSLLLDIYRLLIHAGGLIFQTTFPSLAPSPRIAFVIPFALATAITSYGYFEALSIRTERIVIESPKIPEQVGRITIAQISDIHLGVIVGRERLKRILREVKRAEPDILVSTGDLVDGESYNLRGLTELLKTVTPPYGKFAVTGNHEFFAGIEQALQFTEEAGFKVLRGEALNVAGILNIAGVDDPTGKRFGLYRGVSEKTLLSKLPQEQFIILLKHIPVVDDSANGLFDLQLSGHTHKGQIFPFNLLTRLVYQVDSGLVRVSHNSHLYVSRGSGTWGPPIRFLAPPEVTVIELVPKDK